MSPETIVWWADVSHRPSRASGLTYRSPVLPLRFVPYHRLLDTPNVVVDGSPTASTHLTLSHWPGGLVLAFPAAGSVNGTLVLDRGDGREVGLERRPELPPQRAHRFGTAIKYGDIRTHADGNHRRMRADDAAAKDHHLARCHPGYATQENAPATVWLFQEMRAGLDGHAARHFRHGRQQRKAAGR